MEISANPLDWTSVDSDNLAKFLDTETGRRLIPKLAGATPGLFEGGDTNKILIRSGELRGCRIILQEILDLAHPPPPTPQREDNHPDLLDDSKWTGPKLNDPNPGIL